MLAEAAFVGVLTIGSRSHFPPVRSRSSRPTLIRMKRLAGRARISPTTRSTRLAMEREHDPAAVQARLEQLAALYVPETIEEGEQRLERERPRVAELFENAVERRLEELRALDELARYLHQRH
jgi:hypothetical protein